MATDIDVKSITTHNDAKDPTFNQLLGINNEGMIAGYFGSGRWSTGLHPNKGYTLNPPYGQGNFVNENFPGSVQTQVTGINNNDLTVGFWADAQQATTSASSITMATSPTLSIPTARARTAA